MYLICLKKKSNNQDQIISYYRFERMFWFYLFSVLLNRD